MAGAASQLLRRQALLARVEQRTNNSFALRKSVAADVSDGSRIAHSGPFSVRPLIPREPKSRTRLGRSETCHIVWPGRAPNWHPVSWLRRADRSSISSFHLADLGGEAVDPKLLSLRSDV